MLEIQIVGQSLFILLILECLNCVHSVEEVLCQTKKHFTTIIKLMDINLKQPITDQFRLQVQRDLTSELYWHLKNTATKVPYYYAVS